MSKKDEQEAKEKRRIVAITKRLKEEKGINLTKAEFDIGIKQAQKAQELIRKEAEGNDSPDVQQAADESCAKLQSIIDDINYYMGAVYPEGLIDIGTDNEQGQSIVASG